MSAPVQFKINSTSQNEAYGYFNFGDLDSWVHQSLGTEEHSDRVALANKIVECYQLQPTGLVLEGGKVTSLPRAIGLLTQLKMLDISQMPITELPPEIGNLKNLERLGLFFLDITSLPQEIANFVNLKKFCLQGTPLSSLPKEIEMCGQLDELYLIDTKLTELPHEIGKLKNLLIIDLTDSYSLSNIPEEIGELSNLQVIDLKNTNLSYLPVGIFLLEDLRELSILGCPFSRNGLERLQPHINNSEFPNREIFYDEAPERIVQTTDRPLDELLDEIYFLSKKERPSLEELLEREEVENLRQFLGKLAFTVDFERGGDEQKAALAKKVTEYLELAEKEEIYRERFFAYLEDAATECGDRISLTVIFLELEKRLAEIDLNNLHALYELLLGIWSINLILNIAQETMRSKFVGYEGVEVYLGYLTKLREEFNLPIDVKDMLFFKESRISDRDLQIASRTIALERMNLTKISKFLANHDLWRAALERKSPEIYDEAMNSDSPEQALKEWTINAVVLCCLSLSKHSSHRFEMMPNWHTIPSFERKDYLESWRSDAQGNMAEYANRSIAVARIKEYAATQSPTLNLSGLGLNSLPNDLFHNLPFLRTIDIRGNNISYHEMRNHPQIQFLLDSPPTRRGNNISYHEMRNHPQIQFLLDSPPTRSGYGQRWAPY